MIIDCFFLFYVGNGGSVCVRVSAYVCFLSLDFVGVKHHIACVHLGEPSLDLSFPSSIFCSSEFVDIYCLNLILQ